MAGLNETVRENVFWYAADNDLVKTFKFVNEAETAFAVNLLDTQDRKKNAMVAVIARVQGDYVIIEEDLTDKPLVERLVAAGIPRDKIICAYLGEPIPDIQAN